MRTYSLLLFFHSLFRWLVLSGLLFTLSRAALRWTGQKSFTRLDNKLRHITATLAHVQLTLGYVLYFNSPLVQWFRTHFREAVRQLPVVFFGLIHIILMTLAITFITIGSAVAKRKSTDLEKFRTMTLWYGVALAIILLAIPWPFSPLAKRPFFRTF
ncbi:MAG: hypothetical protein J0H74_34990 [Chitinophagaceae bacterium]|nr:hypothetical protein [Chitinophagaceae bacterium]